MDTRGGPISCMPFPAHLMHACRNRETSRPRLPDRGATPGLVMAGEARVAGMAHDDCIMSLLFSASPPKNTTNRSRVRHLPYESVRGTIAIS
jgi:hypothetical protein